MRRCRWVAVLVALALAGTAWHMLDARRSARRSEGGRDGIPGRRLAEVGGEHARTGDGGAGRDAAGHARRTSADVTPIDGQRLEVTSSSDPSLASVAGHIVSASSGQPIPGAEVTLARGGAAFSTLADESGRFLFETREPGQYRLAMVAAEGHAPFAPSWEASPVQLTLSPGTRLGGILFRLWPLVLVHGEVRNAAGEPVGGATVGLEPHGGAPGSLSAPSDPSEAHQTAISDAAGGFHIAAAGRSVLWAKHPEHGTGRAPVDATRPGVPRVVVTLEQQPDSSQDPRGTPPARTGRIIGRVLDPAGDPVEGAHVLAATYRAGDGEQAQTAVTGPNGTFQLPTLSRGPHLVRATHPDLGEAETFTAVRATATVIIRFAPRGSVRGMARDANTGEPVPHYTLSLTQGLGPGERPVPIARQAVYAADGRYRVDGLNSGRYAIGAAAPGFMPSVAAEFLVDLGSPGQPDAEVNLSLHRGGTLQGHVVDATDSSPIGGAKLFVSRMQSAAQLVPSEDSRTDSDGLFTVTGLPPGRCTVRVEAAGYHDRLLSGVDVPMTAEAHEPVLVTLTPVPPEESRKTEFVGIGATVSKVRRGARVVALIPGGGAAEVGVRPEDVIVAIDGEPAANLDLEILVNALRGVEDTFVQLAIARPAGEAAEAQLLELAVPRRKLTY